MTQLDISIDNRSALGSCNGEKSYFYGENIEAATASLDFTEFWKAHNSTRKEFLDEHISSKENPKVVAALWSGSYGSALLGHFFAEYEKTGEFPWDAHIGASGGAVYAFHFQLWWLATSSEPESRTLESLVKSLPDFPLTGSLSGSWPGMPFNMLMHDQELITGFRASWSKLLRKANISRPRDNLLPELDKLKFSDLPHQMMFLSAKKQGEGKFLPVYFGADDLIFPSLLATSNPCIHRVSSIRMASQRRCSTASNN